MTIFFKYTGFEFLICELYTLVSDISEENVWKTMKA